MEGSRRSAKGERATAAASPIYEAPALTVIGPMSKFTFGSKNNGNDAGAGKKNP
jgi:hypothetical protein